MTAANTPGPWRQYATEQPATAGVYEWRVPSVSVPGLVVRFVAHMRERGAGLGTALSPAFDHWDGYRLHVPAGTEWRECEQISLAEYNYGNLSIEGLAFAPCIYCRRTPTLMASDQSGGSVAICGKPHRYSAWWLACCAWGTTPRLSDPRDIEATRRMAFGRVNAELADALRDILEYRGGADSALDDECVMDRARAALAKATGGAR